MTDLETKTNDVTESQDAKFQRDFEKMKSEIKQLSDNDDWSNDSVEEIDGMLTSQFGDYLQQHSDELQELNNQVSESLKGGNLDPNLQRLGKYLSKLVDSLHNSEQSFDEFKWMIEEWKLNKLNTLKDREVQDVVNFVNDNKNDISSLNLFADMFNQQALYGGDKNFRHTDRKNFYDVFNAVKSHFNMPEWAWVDTAKDLQLGKIFDGKSTLDDLSTIAKDYLWVDNWDWNNLEQKSDWKYAEGVKLIVDYAKFVDKFNELNAARIANETTPDTPDVPVSPETQEVSDLGFDKVVDKEKIWKRMNQERVDIINESVWDNAFLQLEVEDLKYNIENVKNFLKTINNDNFRDYYTKPWDPKRYAWLSATQILLNQNLDGDNKLAVDWEYKRWGETYNAVLNFQKKYNSEHNGDEWFVKLKEDWIPGPKTLSKLLWVEQTTPNPEQTTPNPEQTTSNPEQTTSNPQNLWDTSWMEYAQQTGYLPTGPDNTSWTPEEAPAPTENSDIANNSRGYYADNLLNWTQDV